MAGTQDLAQDHRRRGDEKGRVTRRENEDGAISLGSLAKRDRRCTCAAGRGRVPGDRLGEEPADGVGNCARASQPLERTSERATRGCYEPASLE